MVRPFSIFVVLFSLFAVFTMCFEKACLRSNAILNIFMILFVGSIV